MDTNQPPSRQPFIELDAQTQQELQRLKGDLRQAWEYLKRDAKPLRTPEAAAYAIVLPATLAVFAVRLCLGLPLAIGVFWGLYQALADIFF